LKPRLISGKKSPWEPKEIAVLTAAYADLLPDMLSSKTAIPNPAKDRPLISAQIEATFSR
jgi:hypothetical protein